MTLGNKKLAGLLLFIGTAIGFFGIIIAETRTPNYSTANNYISDLGIGPSATIFNAALIIAGALGTASAYFLHRTIKTRLFPTLVGLSSLGSLGVGLFPENTGIPHVIAALLVFILGGLAAIISYRFTKTPFAQVSVALGAITLLAFSLLATDITLGLGAGGMERVIAYPSMLWSISFGGYLMAESTTQT